MHIRLHGASSGKPFAVPSSLLIYVAHRSRVQIYVGEYHVGACRETVEQIEALLTLARRVMSEEPLSSTGVVGLKELAQWDNE